MGVTTAMLTLLLLCFAPACTPVRAAESFPLLQEQEPSGEPSLQWDGETEDAYRRALHLWKVRGKPGEAADILLGLADTPPVTQLPGQASWVLVLAAQCLTEAGRGEEAAALIPGIERGAKGSSLEAYVARELAAHGGLSGRQEPLLDGAFLNSMVEVFQGTDYPTIQGFVSQFNRALLPYLFAALDLWNSGTEPKNVGVFSFRYALTYLDRQSVPRLIRFSEDLSEMSFLSLVHDTGSYWDDEARLAAWQFWEHLADSKDPEHADRGRRALARLAKSHYELVQKPFEARLAAGDQELENAWLSSIKGERNPAYTEAFRRAYARGGEGRGAALGHFERIGAESELLDLAGAGDEVAACLALALALGSEFSQFYSLDAGPYSSGVSNVVHREVTELTGIAWSLSVNNRSEPPLDRSDPRWKAALGMLERQVQRDAPAGQLFLVLAAFVLEDEATLRRSLAKLSPDAQVVMVSVLTQSKDSHFFPYEVIWGWSGDEAQVSDRRTFDRQFTDLLVGHAAAASLEHVRQRVDLLMTGGRLRQLAESLRALGRDEDLNRLIADDTIPAEAWTELLVAYGQRGEGGAPEVLPLLANRIRRGELGFTSGNTRSHVNDYYAALLQRVATPFSHVDQEQLRVLLEASLSTGSSNSLVTYVATSADEVSVRARQAFCSDAFHAKYLLGAVSTDAPEDLVLAALRLGVPSRDCFRRGVPAPEHFKIGSSARVELIRLLLRSSLAQDVHTGLLLTHRDLNAYQSLTDELAPHWNDPATAARVAAFVGVHRDADPTIIPQMLAAWRIPNLQERQELVSALSNTVDRRVVPVLMEAISDADVKVAEAAREGLKNLKEIEEQRAFWESWETWQARGLGGSPEAALLKQLQSENGEVRVAAVYALGAMRSTNSLPLLISLMEDSDRFVAAAARKALAWISEAPGPSEPPK